MDHGLKPQRHDQYIPMNCPRTGCLDLKDVKLENNNKQVAIEISHLKTLLLKKPLFKRKSLGNYQRNGDWNNNENTRLKVVGEFITVFNSKINKVQL